jgi:hypothetical protein
MSSMPPFYSQVKLADFIQTGSTIEENEETIPTLKLT